MKCKKIPERAQLEIWKRDKWTCRYCGEPVIFAPTLKILSEMNPNSGYYHKNGNESRMLPLLARRWASIDHITPRSKGGTDSLDNYVTACWRCNDKMGNRTKNKTLKEIVNYNYNWDGLSSLYNIINKKSDHWTRLLKG